MTSSVAAAAHWRYTAAAVPPITNEIDRRAGKFDTTLRGKVDKWERTHTHTHKATKIVTIRAHITNIYRKKRELFLYAVMGKDPIAWLSGNRQEHISKK